MNGVLALSVNEVAERAKAAGIDNFVQYVRSLVNFEMIDRKLQSENPTRWTIERISSAKENYIFFLAFTKIMKDVPIVPSVDLDDYWHAHILDTRAYLKDTILIFGEYLHHNPYFGMAGKEEEEDWKRAATESEQIWNAIFPTRLYVAEDGDLGPQRHCRAHCIPSGPYIAGCRHCKSHCVV